MTDISHYTDGEKLAYEQGVIDFVNRMSADYRKHNSVAAHEDMLMAVAYFGIDPSAFYDDSHEQEVLTAQATLYKLNGTVAINV